MDLDISLEQLRRRRGTKWTAYGPDVLPAWIADMDFRIADPVRQAIVRTLDREDTGYAGDASLDELAETFSKRMVQRFGWQPDPALLMPVGNLIQALIASVSSFSRPGEGVLIQTPIYYPFLKIVDQTGRRLMENRLLPGPGGYAMDLEGLHRSVDDNTRLLLFCNPHNPTGRVFRRSELEAVARLAVERDLIVISDEIHADLVYPGNTHIPLATLGPEIAARTITITSASKAFNIAGLKCALIHFGSEELMRRQTGLFSEYLLGRPNNLGIEATLAAWREGDDWLAAVLGQLRANRDRVTERLEQDFPQLVSYPAQATYLAWLDCSALELRPTPYEFFLSEAGVAFSDGGEFGSHTRQFVRLNFATTPDILEQILDRCGHAISRRGS